MIIRSARCVLFLGLTALAVLPTGNSQSKLPTLREEAAKKGHVRIILTVDSFVGKDMQDVISHSDLIIRGRVVGESARLSTSEMDVWTDYSIEVVKINAQGKNEITPGGQVKVTKLGGKVTVDGHLVQEDTPDFPPIPHGAEHIFFLSACENTTCQYHFVGSDYGVIPFKDGKVVCSIKRRSGSPVLGPYCGMTEADFVATLKKMISTSTQLTTQH